MATAPQPRWKAVNDLIHELGDVQYRYRETAADGQTSAYAEHRLHLVRRSLLRVTDDAPEQAVRAAWAALAAARRTIAWARQARHRAAQARAHNAEVRHLALPRRVSPLRTDEERDLVGRILQAARRNR
jgi:hypothetical protein